MKTLNYKGFIGQFWLDEEENLLVGKVINTNKAVIGFEGRTAKELIADFKAGVNDYIKSCQERGKKPEKPLSGDILLRTNPTIHAAMIARAAEKGKSLNAYLNDLLQREIEQEIKAA